MPLWTRCSGLLSTLAPGIEQQRHTFRCRHRRRDGRTPDPLDAAQDELGRCNGCASTAGRQHGIAFAIFHETSRYDNRRILLRADGIRRMLAHLDDLGRMMDRDAQLFPARFF